MVRIFGMCLSGKRKHHTRHSFTTKEIHFKPFDRGKWKLHVSGETPVALYNLEKDIAESTNVLEENQPIADKLVVYIKDFREDIRMNNRPAAFVENPKPLKK